MIDHPFLTTLMDVVNTPAPAPAPAVVAHDHRAHGVALAIGIAAAGFFIGLGIWLGACAHGHAMARMMYGQDDMDIRGKKMQLHERTMQGRMMQDGDRVMLRRERMQAPDAPPAPYAPSPGSQQLQFQPPAPQQPAL